MTENDAAWTVFWCSDGSQTGPPTASVCYVGKNFGEDPSTARADEMLGVIVIEAGSGMLDGVPYVTALGPDSVLGVGNSPPYTYTLSGFSAA